MIPLRDDNPTKTISYVTYLLIAMNVFAWFYYQNAGFDPQFSASILKYGLIPADLLQSYPDGTIVEIAKDFSVTIDGHREWYTLITSMFMHGGLSHLCKTPIPSEMSPFTIVHSSLCTNQNFPL